MLPPITTLWIRGRLSRLHRICLATWRYHGHPVRLYCYEPPDGVPEGVELRDARDVLPAARIFRYRPEAHSAYATIAGGYGGFANWWRYAYLRRHGGWWLDTDVALLKPLADRDFREAVYAPEDRGGELLGNAVLRLPAGCALAVMLCERAAALGDRCRFAETGPTLLTELVGLTGRRWYCRPTDTFYPHGWRDWRRPFQAGVPLPESSHGVHLWHEILRRERIDCEAVHPHTSQIEQIARRFTHRTP